MEHSIELSENRVFIHIKLNGDVTRENMIPVIIEAHELGKDLNINRYLVDATEARNNDSIFNNYKFAHMDMRDSELIDKTARVATLVSPDDHSHDFIETVAQNAFLNFRLFTDRKEAEGFLLS